MSIGLVGRKSGMTRIFTEEGTSIPVTVVEVQPNRVTQIKTPETDGYTAIQVTTGSRRASRVTKGMAGHFAKANTEAGTGLWEFRAEGADIADLTTGSEIKVDLFAEGQMVDVTGTSKGKGFQGGVKRHNFQMQDATLKTLTFRATRNIYFLARFKISDSQFSTDFKNCVFGGEFRQCSTRLDLRLLKQTSVRLINP